MCFWFSVLIIVTASLHEQGHWLDDSRLINSYTLQPQDLLELQLRSHYIQLPPPGGDLNYGDHYAEGTLFKLSKKSKSVSMLTNHGGKEALGVWKERWVVLQGHRLLIYHKRKVKPAVR